MYCDIELECDNSRACGCAEYDENTTEPAFFSSIDLMPCDDDKTNHIISAVIREMSSTSEVAEKLCSLSSEDDETEFKELLSSLAITAIKEYQAENACNNGDAVEHTFSVSYTLWEPIYVEETYYDYDYDTGEPYPIEDGHWEREAFYGNEFSFTVES